MSEVQYPYYLIQIDSADQPTSVYVWAPVVASDLDQDSLARAVAAAIATGVNSHITPTILRHDDVSAAVPYPAT